ncbi:MAG: hypothetical protein ABI725_06970 [Chloroflexota bacterium]
MPDKRTTARAFHAANGVEDWRVLFWGAYAYFRVGSFAEVARTLGLEPDPSQVQAVGIAVAQDAGSDVALVLGCRTRLQEHRAK